MTVKIISKLVKICSLIVFTMCLKVKISSVFVRIFKELISLLLIIPKLSRRTALTIVNAPGTLCAPREAALTSFAFLALPAACYDGAKRGNSRISPILLTGNYKLNSKYLKIFNKMRFVKSCKNLFRIFLYVCTLIGLQLDYSTEFTPTRIFNRTIQNHKKFIGL